MNLDEVKKPYDLIVSLGSSCSPAAHLRRNHLRKFSMPFDWIVTPKLSDINRVIQNQFKDFMLLENLQRIDGQANFLDDNEIAQNSKAYFVQDTHNNMLSVHDFPILPNKEWNDTYPAYRQKLERRIERFLLQLQQASSILFIRWSGNLAEAIEMQQTLKKCVNGSFHILLLTPDPNLEIVQDTHVPMEDICILKVPNQPDNTLMWDKMLDGILLKP
ncbi:DUF1796 family putative cysteine peptidase [Guptibacillus hwajinpoensis]|uniref:DUF1796 family putative cysteine peptidase n=1 Tax=Guptibacillus hwajinpoensis TaxID=208199 RepID=UPI00384D2DDA